MRLRKHARSPRLLRSVLSTPIAHFSQFLLCSAALGQSQFTPPTPTTLNINTPTISSSEPIQLSTHETVSLSSGAVGFYLPVVSLPQRDGNTLNIGFTLSGNQFTLKETSAKFTTGTNQSGEMAQTSTIIQGAGGSQTSSNPWGSLLHPNVPMLTADSSYAGEDSHLPHPETGPVFWINKPEYCMQNWTFTDWDGTVSSFPGTRDCNNGDGEYFQWFEPIPLANIAAYSNDDRDYILDASNTADIRVIKRDGSVYHFYGPYHSPPPVGGCNTCSSTQDDTILNYYYSYVGSIVDRNGNTITTSNGPNGLSITDSVGRVVTVTNTSIQYQASSGSGTTTAAASVATLPGNGATVPWPFSYQSYQTSNSSGPCSAMQVTGTVGNDDGFPPPTVSYLGPGTDTSTYPAQISYSITLANSSTYILTFDPLGNVIKVQYPGGGYTKYDYLYGRIIQTKTFGDVQCIIPSNELLAKHECSSSSGSCSPAPTVTAPKTCVAGSPSGGEDTTCYSGLFSSVPQLGGSGTDASVIDPAGNLSVHASAGNQITTAGAYLPYYKVSDVYYAGQSILLKTITYDYTDSATGCSSGTVYRLQPCVTTTVITAGSSTLTTKEEMNYSQFGDLTLLNTYGFGGGLLKSMTAQWNTTGIYSPGQSSSNDFAGRYGIGSQIGQMGLHNILDSVNSVVVTDAVTEKTLSHSYSYDGAANIQQVVVSGSDVASATTSYTPLDAWGRPTQSSDPLGNITKYDFSDKWRDSSCAPQTDSKAYISKRTNALNQSLSYTYDSCTGALATITDPNGQTISFMYDVMGRTSYEAFPDGGSIQNTFNDTPPLSIESITSQSPNPPKMATAVFDGFTRVVQKKTAAGYVDFTYDGLGQTASRSNPYFAGTVPSGTTLYNYDTFGHLIGQVQPDGSRLWWCYNGISDPQQPQGICRGNLSSATGTWVDGSDEADTLIQKVSDSTGELIAVVEPSSLETDYVYSGFGDLTGVNQLGKATEIARRRSFSYDALSRLTTSYNPETGTICYGTTSSQVPTSSNCQSNGYDVDGNVIYKTDASGQTTSYQYDALNRLRYKFKPDQGIAEFVYDGNGRQGGPPQNAIGRLTASSNDVNGGEWFDYDAMGRVAQEKYCLPSDCSMNISVRAGYDLAGNMISLTYPDGRQVTSQFDAAGRVSDAGDGGNTQNYLQSMTYQPNGSPYQLTLGNGIVQTWQQNNRLQVSDLSISDPLSGATYLDHTYCYVNCPTGGQANNGNIWQITDNLNGSRTQSYTYDNLNRLSGFLLGGSLNEQYATDSFGNLSGVVNAQPTIIFDPATNRVSNLPCASSVTPYDGKGNQLCTTDQYGMISQYTYDAENRISKINTLNGAATPFVSYIYDGGGSRIAKQIEDGTFTEYINFNGQTLAEKDQAGNYTDYIFADGRRIARVDAGDTAMHIYGTNSDYGQTAGWYIPVPTGYIIRSGDTLSWRQYQGGSAAGGLVVALSDAASGSFEGAVNGVDEDGDAIHKDTVRGSWHTRVADLSQYAGLSIYNLWLSSFSDQGSWDIWYEDLILTRSDGSVIPLYNHQSSVAFTQYEVYSGITNAGVAVDITTVPSSSVASVNRTTFLLGDHLGSAQMELSSSGWPLSMSQFKPFGEESDGQTTTSHFKFTGKERDAESGLDYFGARYYASSMGRWVSPDKPFADQHTADPQSWNMYSYTRNSPLSSVDPDGQAVVVLTALALQRVQSTLPSDVRSQVTADKNGVLNRAAIDGIKSTDSNVLLLQQAVDAQATIELNTAPSVQGGQPSEIAGAPFEYQSTAGVQADVKAAGGDPSQITGPNVYDGYTQTAGQSPSGNIRVTVADGTGKTSTEPAAALASTTAHELYGHALKNAQGKPYEHDNGGPVDKDIKKIEDHTKQLNPQ